MLQQNNSTHWNKAQSRPATTKNKSPASPSPQRGNNNKVNGMTNFFTCIIFSALPAITSSSSSASSPPSINEQTNSRHKKGSAIPIITSVPKTKRTRWWWTGTCATRKQTKCIAHSWRGYTKEYDILRDTRETTLKLVGNRVSAKKTCHHLPIWEGNKNSNKRSGEVFSFLKFLSFEQTFIRIVKYLLTKIPRETPIFTKYILPSFLVCRSAIR